MTNKEIESGSIQIHGAKEHNLKNIDLTIPRNKLIVFTGLSGSGKSSLAFDTLFAEGQRRYIETFSSYVRQFIGGLERPDVDKIDGLSPVIAIEQKTVSRSPRSTVGTITELYDFFRLLFARAGTAYSYVSGNKMIKYSDDEIASIIQKKYLGKKSLYHNIKKKLTKKELAEQSGPGRKSATKTVLKESDWKTYYGSAKPILGLLKENKHEEFKREIITTATSKKLLTYYECKYLFMLGVLEHPLEYFNDNVLGKFYSKDFI